MDAKLSAEFDAHIQAALAGHGRLIVVEGGPGSGKTSVLSTLAQLAAGRGLAVWECVELPATAALPLGGLVDRVEAALHALSGQVAGTLTRGVSAVRDVDGLARVVQRFSERRPLAVLVDDLHHTDAQTVAFLAHATRWVSRFPLLLVASYLPAERLSRLVGAVTHRVALDAWSTARVREAVKEADAHTPVVQEALLVADLQRRARGHAAGGDVVGTVGAATSMPGGYTLHIGRSYDTVDNACQDLSSTFYPYAILADGP